MPYDVLAVRQRRLEAEGKAPWPFVLGADEFELPAEPPQQLLPFLAKLAPAIDAQTEGGQLPTDVIVQFPDMVAQLVGPAQLERFERHQLSVQDVAGLLMTYFEEAFGGSLGESAGSPGSSPTPGGPTTSKPTSKRTTASRSRSTSRAR